ncbi:MAG TPA: arginase family protein [Candidatus Limnocylindrales bacterium]
MDRTIAVVGVPTALGGELPADRHVGMAEAPADLRRLGFLDRLTAAGLELRDDGDVPVDLPFRHDPDPQAKNRALIGELLPREAELVARAVANGERLLVLGGDCCAHAGAMAGLRRARPDRRLAIAWFDAHGDLNTPETTPSGHVWGMPFAMLLGRGAADLVGAVAGPTAELRHAALIGGQVLDEPESRWVAGSPVAHYGAGMLRTAAGRAALAAWAAAVGSEVDGLYVAVDHDVLDADETAWAVTMPETRGLPAEDAVEAVRILAAAMPVVGYGATALNFATGGDAERTVEVAAALAVAALG